MRDGEKEIHVMAKAFYSVQYWTKVWHEKKKIGSEKERDSWKGDLKGVTEENWKLWRSFGVNKDVMILVIEKVLRPANTIHSLFKDLHKICW